MITRGTINMFWMLIRIAVLLLLFRVVVHTAPATADEATYVRQHCLGEIEVILLDKTRVDCLTDTHAIEYDFGHKWAEAVGQSLHYAANTGRRAGIVLIKPNDRHYFRLKMLIDHYNLPITLWRVD